MPRRKIWAAPPPLEVICRAGTWLPRSTTDLIPWDSSFSPVTADTVSGVFCRFSLRRWAVTTTSSSWAAGATSWAYAIGA